jgi:hypothetical protein
MRWLIAVAGMVSLQGTATWEFRYGQQPDQTAEWTAMGRLPAWIIRVGADGNEITWEDLPDGRCRGWLLVARPVTVTAAARHLSLRLRYRTFCQMDAPTARSGMLHAIAMTRAAWDELARTPTEARVWSPSGGQGGILATLIKGQGDDVLEWADPGEVVIGPLPQELRQQPELMVGVAWGAWHFCPENGGIRGLVVTPQAAPDRQLLAALDVDRPGLEVVREAVGAGDETAALAALTAYYRQGARPAPANPVEPASDAVLARADETLQHTYRLAGCPPFTFPGPIVWNHDPFNYNQWPIHLNRHTEWRFLAAAYRRTGEARYAREWAAQVVDWVQAMPVLIPPFIQGPFNASGKASLSLDAGIRTGQSWFPAFEVFRGCAEVTDEALLAFAGTCLDHGRYLMREENFRVGSNWGAMECNGLFHLGVLLPEFREAVAWRETALRRAYAELDNQVYPDGAQVELAPGYHGVTLSNLLGILRLARSHDVALPADFVARLERMFEYSLRIALPDLRLPALNDSGWQAVGNTLREGFELFPERDDFRWGASGRREGQPPAFESLVMPYAGWVVMRSGWGPADCWLLFDAGPFGTGHQHEDKLSIILAAYGRPLVTEAGVYAYDTSAWRRYVLSTRAHSTLRVDGQDQNCRADRREYRAARPETYGFFDNPAFCYARDAHTAGYGTPPDRSVVHRRRVLFVKPYYWLVVDDLGASDARPHQAEAQFLLDAASAEIEPSSLSASSLGGGPGRVAVMPLPAAGLAARIAQGEEEPEVRGFIPVGFNRLRPAPAVLYTLPFVGRGCLVFVLAPFEGESVPVHVAESTTGDDGLTFSLRGPDARTRRFQVTPELLACLDPETPFAAREGPLLPGEETTP